jgi:hypothetical protein
MPSGPAALSGIWFYVIGECHPELCLDRAELFEFAGGPRELMEIHMPGFDARTAGGFYKRLQVIFYYQCEIVGGRSRQHENNPESRSHICVRTLPFSLRSLRPVASSWPPSTPRNAPSDRARFPANGPARAPKSCRPSFLPGPLLHSCREKSRTDAPTGCDASSATQDRPENHIPRP